MTRAPVAALALLMLLGALGTLYVYAGRSQVPEPLAIRELRGEVVRIRDQHHAPGQVGMHLGAGDRLVTGQDGGATLSRGSGASLRVASGTTIELSRIDDNVLEVALERGQVRARVRPDAGAVRIGHRGRSVLATDAAFAVATDGEGALAVQARTGAVAVSGVPDVWRLGAGEQLLAFPGGEAAVGPISPEPLLDVEWPPAVDAPRAVVSGSTEPGAWVRVVDPAVDGPQVRADAGGRFQIEIPVEAGRTQVVVAVRDAFGRERRATGVLTRTGAGPSYRLDLDPRR